MHVFTALLGPAAAADDFPELTAAQAFILRELVDCDLPLLLSELRARLRKSFATSDADVTRRVWFASCDLEADLPKAATELVSGGLARRHSSKWLSPTRRGERVLMAWRCAAQGGVTSYRMLCDADGVLPIRGET